MLWLSAEGVVPAVTAAGWAPVPSGRACDKARLLCGPARPLLSSLQNMSENAGGLRKVSKMHEVTWEKNAVGRKCCLL